jgi:hypothetical protein
MNLWKRPFSVIKKHGVDALMPHAIQVRQTGDPEVPNWTRVRRLARELKQQDLGDPASREIHKRSAKQPDSRRAIGFAPATAMRS